jgi:metal-responsive CopG/Arc/MetJ family transcriptional regulator
MRLRISLDDDLVRQIDRRVGSMHRSTFIGESLRCALDDQRRWEDIEAGLGALRGRKHEWDDNTAGWVTTQRSGDPTRTD